MIERQKIIENPKSFDVDLGKNPVSTINNYTSNGFIPSPITVGGLKGGHTKVGYYPDVVIGMLRDINEMRKIYKYAGIKIEMHKKYESVFEIYDMLTMLTELNFVKKPVLEAYLKDSTINKEAKEKIHEIYCADLARKEIKLKFLDLLSTQNLHL